MESEAGSRGHGPGSEKEQDRGRISVFFHIEKHYEQESLRL